MSGCAYWPFAPTRRGTREHGADQGRPSRRVKRLLLTDWADWIGELAGALVDVKPWSAQYLRRLGEASYTVAEVCRILGRSMTPRKVHYWLNTGLISGTPVVRGRRGVPTILTFRQLLEIRTVQYLRDTLRVSLHEVRDAFAWVLNQLFERRTQVAFRRGPNATLIAQLPHGEEITVPAGQTLLPITVEEMTGSVAVTLQAWRELRLQIAGFNSLVTNSNILGGAPTIDGTRIDTASVAALADTASLGGYDKQDVDLVLATYPQLKLVQVEDAFAFEGLQPIAA